MSGFLLEALIEFLFFGIHIDRAEGVSAGDEILNHFRKNIHGVAAGVMAKEHNMRAVFLFVPIHALAVGFKKVLLCGQVIDIALRPTVVVAGIPIEPCVTFFCKTGFELPPGKRTRMFVCGEPTAFSYAAAHLSISFMNASAEA